MLESSEDLAILEGVLSLAIAFRRQAIAEGVETQAHAEMLLQLGCDLAQGYAIARPMPIAELMDWAISWRPPAGWGAQPLVSRSNIPLLFAGIEHKVWIRKIEEYINGNFKKPLQLDIHKCRFGVWLDGERKDRYDRVPALKVIESLHQQVHSLSTDLLILCDQKKRSEARARLGELHRLRDDLLGQLKTLISLTQQNR
jgi:hypothetical protein